MFMKDFNKILSLCIQKDQIAITQLYNFCHKELIKICENIALNSYDVDEMFNDGFTKILVNLSKFNSNKLFVFTQWGRIIMKNTCINYIKKYNKIKSFEENVGYNPLPEFPTIISNKMLLQKTMKILSPLQLKAIYLFYYKNLTTFEIAKILNIKSGACRTMLHRSRQKLKIELEKNIKLWKI